MQSNRRGFLKFLSTAPVAAEVAKSAPKAEPIPAAEVKISPAVSHSMFCTAMPPKVVLSSCDWSRRPAVREAK